MRGAKLYEDEPWELPAFAEDTFDKLAYEPKPIHWYTKIERQTGWSFDVREQPYTYAQESADVLWDRLTERLGFESVPFAPGTEITHPAEPERTLTVDAVGAIAYKDRTVFDENEEPVCLFGPEGPDKAVEYLTEPGIDPSDYRYSGREYVMGDTARQYRELPYGGKEFADVSQTCCFTWIADEIVFEPKRAWHSIEVNLYYDRLESVSFRNYMPVRQDPMLGSPVFTKTVSAEDLENYLKGNGIRVGRLMGPLRCVTVESAKWMYTCDPLDYFFTPRFCVSGHATDGFKVMPFTVYLDPGEY